MKKIFIVLLAIFLTGCSDILPQTVTDAIPSEDSKNLVSIRTFDRYADENGFYSMQYLPGLNIYTYTDLATATEEIVTVGGEPLVFEIADFEHSVIPSKIIPLEDTFLYIYSTAEGMWVEQVDKKSGQATVLHREDMASVWPLAYDGEFVYLSVLMYNENTQKIIQCDADGNATELASLSTDEGILGHDIATYEIRPVQQTFYAFLPTQQGVVVSKLEQDGSLTEIATLPGREETIYSDFYNDACYHVSKHLKVTCLNLWPGEVAQVGQLASEYPIDYLTNIGDELFQSYYYDGEAGMTLLVNLQVLTVNAVDLTYRNQEPMYDEYESPIRVMVKSGEHVAVVNDMAPATIFTTNNYVGYDEFARFSFEQTAFMSISDYVNNVEKYTPIDRTQVESLIFTQ